VRTRTEPPSPSLPPGLRGWLIAVIAVTVLPWIVVAVWFGRPGSIAPQTVRSGSEAAEFAKPGPWGKLRIVPIVISPPLEYVSTEPGPSEGVWHLPGIKPEVAPEFLAVYGLTAEQVATLRPTIRADAAINGSTVKPPAGLVRGLAPEVRAKLYGQLARTSLNGDQHLPFRYPALKADDWFWGHVIAPETRTMVERLLYRQDSSMQFADLSAVRAELTGSELQRLIKVLNRRRTYLVKLTLEDPQGIDAVAEYWGTGGRRTDIRAMIESTAGAAAEPIDIVHLLPNFGRDYLYRFARITGDDLARPIIANCLWTALNFFNRVPDDRFLDVGHALAVLKQDYYLVQANYRLGDVIAFVDENETIFHVAVYLADDLVFTKNGTTPMAPWAIMKLEDVVETYRFRSPNPKLIYHRSQAY
jgi:hypothetical protein